MICINAEPRNDIGSYFAQEYRKQGKIPATLYGKNKENINMVVNVKEIQQVKNKRNCAIMSLQVNNKNQDVILHDIQYHPVTLEPLHVDFLMINKKEKVKVNVPIRYLNIEKCIGVKQGGHLNKIYRRLPLFCLPSDIPESIEIDTEKFNIGKIIRISDICLSDGVEHLNNQSIVVCNIIGRASKAKEAEGESAEKPAES